MKQSFSDILSKIGSDSAGRLSAKVPCWAGTSGLEIPASINLEQCSSGAAAAYKARRLSELHKAGSRECPPGLIADLTGGLGSDSYAFSKVAGKVRYNEMNAVLCEAVKRNFGRLSVDNVEFSSMEATAASIAELSDGADWVYMDPARRSSTGRKVFLLEDCTPNVLELLPLIHCPVMLKLSPMADITMLCRKLDGLSRIEVVSVEGECKELLCMIGDRNVEEPAISAVDLDREGNVTGQVSFVPASLHPLSLASGNGWKYVFEPGAALSKAGALSLIEDSTSMRALGRESHLFVSDGLPEKQGPLALGKAFEVLEVLPFGKESFRRISAAYPRADVTARGIPMTSDELSKRLGVRPSNEGLHIFGVSDAEKNRLLIVSKRLF